MAAYFIDEQCRTTQEHYIGAESTPEALALRVDFLMGYYDAYSKSLAGSRLKQVVRWEYEQTLTNALACFRQLTTNDLGADPRAWIKRYGSH
jgi:hypothetical protein